MGKKIVVYIIDFFLTIAILGLVCLFVFTGTVFNKEYMVGKLEENNYYKRTDNDIKDTFKNYIMQSGLEESILEGLYNDDKLNNDINSVVNAIYDDTELKIETDSIRDTLNTRIDVTLKENHRTPDKEEKESIKEFVDTIVEVYDDGVAYSEETIKKIGDVFSKVISLLQKAKIGVIVAVICLVIIILVVNRNLQDSVRAIGASVLSCGIIFVAIKLLIGKRLHYILIFNNTFSDTLINISEAVMNTVWIIGIVMAIIGIVAIVIGSFNYGNGIEEKVFEKKVGTHKGKH